MGTFLSSAILRYSYIEGYGFKLIAEVDKDLGKYYFSLIPKYYYVNSQYYAPHISIIRKEAPASRELWELSEKENEGREIKFLYRNLIYTDGVYWWLDVFSKDIIRLRRFLGVRYKNVFHISLGNNKNV